MKDERGCQTDGFMLEGGDGWYPTLFIRLIQDYGFDIDVRTYVLVYTLILCTYTYFESYGIVPNSLKLGIYMYMYINQLKSYSNDLGDQ